MPEVSCKAVAIQKQLWMALLQVTLPPAQTGGGEDIIYIFLIFPGHLEFWTPLKSLFGAPLLVAPCYTLPTTPCRGTSPENRYHTRVVRPPSATKNIQKEKTCRSQTWIRTSSMAAENPMGNALQKEMGTWNLSHWSPERITLKKLLNVAFAITIRITKRFLISAKGDVWSSFPKAFVGFQLPPLCDIGFQGLQSTLLRVEYVALFRKSDKKGHFSSWPEQAIGCEEKGIRARRPQARLVEEVRWGKLKKQKHSAPETVWLSFYKSKRGRYITRSPRRLFGHLHLGLHTDFKREGDSPVAVYVFPGCTIFKRNITHRRPEAMAPGKQYPLGNRRGLWFSLSEWEVIIWMLLSLFL